MRKKISLYAPPLSLIMLQLPFTLTQATMMVIGACVSKEHHCALHRFPSLHTPSGPFLTAPTTFVTFFILLWFSDLVPYVAILKTFHIKKISPVTFETRLVLGLSVRASTFLTIFKNLSKIKLLIVSVLCFEYIFL